MGTFIKHFSLLVRSRARLAVKDAEFRWLDGAQKLMDYSRRLLRKSQALQPISNELGQAGHLAVDTSIIGANFHTDPTSMCKSLWTQLFLIYVVNHRHISVTVSMMEYSYRTRNVMRQSLFIS
jgi:hypothetical protein